MREETVYRVWQRAHGRYFQRYLIHTDPGDVADSVNVYSLFALLFTVPLDLTIMGVEWDPWGLRRVAALPGLPFSLAWAGLIVANGVRVDRQLRRWIPGHQEARPWMRLGRALAFSLPLASFLAVPLVGLAAEDRGERRSARPAGRVMPSLSGSSKSRSRSQTVRGGAAAPGPKGQGIRFIVEVVITGVSVCWLTGEGAPPRGRRIVLVCISGAVHFGTTILLLWVIHRSRRGHLRGVGRARVSGLWLPLLCLAPSPLGLTPVIVDLCSRSTDESLVWKAFASLRQPDRTPLGWALRRRLWQRYDRAGWWSRWRTPSGDHPALEDVSADRRLRELVYAKSWLTVGDGVILGWMRVAYAGGLGEDPAGRLTWIDPLIWIPAMAAIGGLVLLGGGYLGTILRIPGASDLSRRPYGEALVWTGWAIASGVAAGGLIAGGAVTEGLALLVIASPLPIVTSAIGLILRPLVVGGPPRIREAGWCLSPLLWAFLALAYSRPEGWFRGLAAAVVLLTPIGHLLLASTLGRWLLWPFRFDHLFGPGLAFRRRALLGFLAATLLLPGGGIASPFWVLARHGFAPAWAPSTPSK